MADQNESLAASRGFKGLLQNAFLLLVSVAFFIPLAELGLRLAMPGPTVYRALAPHLEATYSGRPREGIQGPSLFKVNSMGVRSREWSEDRDSEHRVLCLGGSTTEGLFADQSRVWTALLERRLGRNLGGKPAWVGNIGKSGISSRSHVLQMRHLLGVYDPDTVVILLGFNDLTSRLKAGQDYDPRFLDKPENQLRLMRETFAAFPGQFSREWPEDPWFKRTRLWRLLRLLKYRVLKAPEYVDPEGRSIERWRALRAQGKRASVLPPLAEGLDEYERNLREIVRRGRAQGVHLVLVTQPVLWRAGLTDQEAALLWLGGVGEFQSVPEAVFYEPEALAEGMDRYNERLLRVCRSTGTTCVDLAAVVPRSTEYFWDDCHFTDKGQELVAETIAQALLQTARPAEPPPGRLAEGSLPGGVQGAGGE